MSSTHTVLNQSEPRVNVNEFTSNIALCEATQTFAPNANLQKLEHIGQTVGGADYQRDAQLANTFTPIHRSHDQWGHRVDEIDFHPAYHNIMGQSVEWGLHTSAWANPGPGANVERATGFMLVSQIEPGHGCPISMAHAAVPALRYSPEIAKEWEPKLLSTTYEPELRDPATKQGAIFGMAMTEKQGGSDVRANTTEATPNADGTYTLRGHKWFCSAPQSDAFLVLAQLPEGLSCFLVPRILPGGERNPFYVQRLKDKLGNKSNASSEIELDGTIGQLIGDPGRGVRTIIEMVNRTRLDCVLGAAAGMRQTVAEAAWHTRHRKAFGATLIDQPAMTNVIADLQLEAEAATWQALSLAADHDDPNQASYRRLATAVAKYWICKRGPHHAYEGMECLGGNGYTELFPLARRYREQPVLAIWEGSGNVIALDVLRAMAKEPESFEAFDARMASAAGKHELYDAQLNKTRGFVNQAMKNPAEAPAIARQLIEAMALTMQAQTLIEHASPTVAEAFIRGRLSDGRGFEYGTLPEGVDLETLVSRA